MVEVVVDLEHALRAALARRGLTLRSAELVDHVDPELGRFIALVLHFEGRKPVYDIASDGYDFGDERDCETWVYIHYGKPTQAEEPVLVAGRAG